MFKVRFIVRVWAKLRAMVKVRDRLQTWLRDRVRISASNRVTFRSSFPFFLILDFSTE